MLVTILSFRNIAIESHQTSPQTLSLEASIVGLKANKDFRIFGILPSLKSKIDFSIWRGVFIECGEDGETGTGLQALPAVIELVEYCKSVGNSAYEMGYRGPCECLLNISALNGADTQIGKYMYFVQTLY